MGFGKEKLMEILQNCIDLIEKHDISDGQLLGALTIVKKHLEILEVKNEE